MPQRTRAVVSLLFAAVVAVPGAAAAVEGHDASDHDAEDLDAARRELTDAERSLAELETAVQRTRDEVAALDERLRKATTDLDRVAEDLATAEVALAEARADERIAASALADADADLEAALVQWRSNRELLQARAIHSFKHGTGGHHDLLVRGVTGAGDWHEVAVTLETASRIAADDRDLVAESIELTRATTELRQDAGAARTRSVTAARTAIEEERRVASLHEQQAAIVAEVEGDLQERARVLSSLESDAAARAVLVAELERRVTDLELSARRVLVPVQVDLDVHGPPPAWADRLPAHGRQYAAAFDAIGARHGIDGRLVASLVWAESNFRPDAVSHAGALGLAQLMPGTARGLGVDPRDPLDNVDGGTRYLRSQLDRFGSVDLALAAYNAGPGRVERAGGVPDIVETQLYVVRVLDLYERISG